MSIPFFPTRTLFSSKNDLTTHLHWPKSELENQKRDESALHHKTAVQINTFLQHAILPFTEQSWKYIHMNMQPIYFKRKAEDTNNMESQILNTTLGVGNL